jgi:hypothetical protein
MKTSNQKVVDCVNLLGGLQCVDGVSGDLHDAKRLEHSALDHGVCLRGHHRVQLVDTIGHQQPKSRLRLRRHGLDAQDLWEVAKMC